jgi:gamma-D-glutamyl-L-lysine dipeptidyl-peptidase
MRRIPRLLLCLLLMAPLSWGLLSARAQEPPKGRTAMAVVSSAEIFKKSTKRSEHVTEILMGDEFRVIKEAGEWAYGSIPSQKGYRGWVRKKDISFVLSESPFEGRSFVLVRATMARITFRDGTAAEVFAGTSLPLVRKNSVHYEVIMPDGSTGFLPVDSGTIEDENFGKDVTPTDILKSTRFFNAHYKWGGITASGMDCSGFVYTVFRINGIYLKRDSYMQAEEGTAVPFTDLREGDLVFFTSKKGGRITHVGIYIGNGNFVHSSRGKRGVGVSSLSEDYFRRRLAAARRILHDGNQAVQDKVGATRRRGNGSV